MTPLRDLPKHPIAGGLGLIALGLFAVAGNATDAFVFDARAWEGEAWRVLTATLVHGDLLHLGFNVWWLWLLGAPIESRIGSGGLAGLVLCTAIGSAIPQYALSGNAIGLSGVVYGLAAYLWLAGRHDPRFSGVLSERDAKFLVFWFGLCILLSQFTSFAIANVAHGMGAAFGFLAAASRIAVGWRRLFVFVGATLVLALAGVGATVARPLVNFSMSASSEHFVLGNRAMGRGDVDSATRHYERATQFRQVVPEAWYNLGVVRQRQSDEDGARAAFDRAHELGVENIP